MTRIGFVGLGRMGRAMAPHLAGEGRQVTGHDLVRPDPLPANVGFSARLEDLAASDLIITMLPDGAAVRGVVDRLLDEGCAAAVIDMSSSHPDDSRALAARLAERGLSFVDAPVSGGVSRAISAELMIMAGGTYEAVAAAMPVLACLGRPVHLGPAGCGHAMKALNNYVSAASTASPGSASSPAPTTIFSIRPVPRTTPRLFERVVILWGVVFSASGAARLAPLISHVIIPG